MIPTLHWARTRDGMRLALYNYRPARLDPERAPVFLCHGMGSNRFDLDYPDARLSLAKYLWREGHDVWVVELRGAGRSTRPHLFFGALRYNWVLDDYVEHDIPAAVSRVLEITSRTSIHWVGHSMGGMLAYPFLATCDAHLVRSCVTVGAPSLARVASPLHDAGARMSGILRFVPLIPYGFTGRVVAPFARRLRGLFESVAGSFFYNPRNMTDEALAVLLGNAVDDLPPSLVLQLVRGYREKHHRSYYGTFSIRDNLHRIETPTLIIAGSIDALTPPDDLRYVFEHLGSETKGFVVIGRESGAPEEYGHVDLILGKDAARDVYPTISAWIARHDRARATRAPARRAQAR